jgi:hypothetical protein
MVLDCARWTAAAVLEPNKYSAGSRYYMTMPQLAALRAPDASLSPGGKMLERPRNRRLTNDQAAIQLQQQFGHLRELRFVI